MGWTFSLFYPCFLLAYVWICSISVYLRLGSSIEHWSRYWILPRAEKLLGCHFYWNHFWHWIFSCNSEAVFWLWSWQLDSHSESHALWSNPEKKYRMVWWQAKSTWYSLKHVDWEHQCCQWTYHISNWSSYRGFTRSDHFLRFLRLLLSKTCTHFHLAQSIYGLGRIGNFKFTVQHEKLWW